MRFKLTCVALLAAIPVLASANCTIPAFTSTFRLKAGGAHGTITRSLANNGSKGYLFKEVTKARVLFFGDTITQTSAGNVTSSGVSPTRYEIIDTHSHQPFVVDYQLSGGKAVATYRGHSQTLSGLSDGTQDPLSYQLVLRQALADGTTSLPTFTLVNQNKAKQAVVQTLHFSAPVKTMVSVPMGHFEALKVTYHPAKSSDTVAYFFAPKLNYALVKSETLKKSGSVAASAVLTSYQAQQSCVMSR